MHGISEVQILFRDSIGHDLHNHIADIVVTHCCNLAVFVLFLCSYDMLMFSCWKTNPKERLTFAELVITIESILSKVAQYLDFYAFALNIKITGDVQVDTDEN